MKKLEIPKPDMVEFIISCKSHIKEIDRIMEMKESLERGKLIAKEMNRFNLDTDRFLHFGLGIKLTRLNNILNPNFNF